jgi:hypothetical protein
MFVSPSTINWKAMISLRAPKIFIFCPSGGVGRLVWIIEVVSFNLLAVVYRPGARTMPGRRKNNCAITNSAESDFAIR